MRIASFGLIFYFLTSAFMVHPVKADAFAKFFQIQCIPELNYFSAAPLYIRGEKAESTFQDSTLTYSIENKHSLLSESSKQKSIKSGKCSFNNYELSWAYEDIIEPAQGPCGGGDWGGYLTVFGNGSLILKKLHIGGSSNRACNGSTIQEITITTYRKYKMELAIKGDWASDRGSYTKIERFNLPIETKAFNIRHPKCKENEATNCSTIKTIIVDFLR